MPGFATGAFFSSVKIKFRRGTRAGGRRLAKKFANWNKIRKNTSKKPKKKLALFNRT
jgi:hypothetical protein